MNPTLRAAGAWSRAAGLAAAVFLGWCAWRVLRAQLALPNLVPHLHALLVLALATLVLAMLATGLGRRTAAPSPRAVEPARDPRGARPGAWLKSKDALPVVLDGRVHLLGSAPSCHVRMQLPGVPARLARIERRGDGLALVPEEGAEGLLQLRGRTVVGDQALRVGDRLHVLGIRCSWSAVIEEGNPR